MDEERAVDTMILKRGRLHELSSEADKEITTKELCSRISLAPEAVEQLMKVRVSEEEYRTAYELFQADHGAFYADIREKENSRLLFLYYYLRFAYNTYQEYMDSGLSREIFFNTFLDIGYWCSNCYDRYGEYGINEYEWISKLIDHKVIRLGRLEYEPVIMEKDILVPELILSKGEKVIFVHIPQGSRLNSDECDNSLGEAYKLLGKKHKYACYSWLLEPKLLEIIPAESNIALFQKRFDIKGLGEDDRQAEERVFGRILDTASEYPDKTMLQRKIREYLIKGGSLGCGFGIMKH